MQLRMGWPRTAGRVFAPFLFCCWCAGVSAAQQPRPRPALAAMDADGDGTLSAQELQAAPAALLTLDRNGDGQLTTEELQPPRSDAGASPDQLVTQMMALDHNGDGVLTPDEVPERMRAMFARGDRNHDGKLTPEEIRQMAAHTGVPAGHGGSGNRAAGMMRLDPVLNVLDADHDGTISAAEIRGATAALQSLDGNHDGVLEPAEMRVRQQTPEERTAHVLEEFDTDKDGKLSRDEAPDGLRPGFSAADTNGDGMLDHAELLMLFTAMQRGTQAGPGTTPGTPPAAEEKPAPGATAPKER